MCIIILVCVKKKDYKFLLGGRFNFNQTREWKDILNCQIKSGNYSDTPFLVITAALFYNRLCLLLLTSNGLYNKFKLVFNLISLQYIRYIYIFCMCIIINYYLFIIYYFIIKSSKIFFLYLFLNKQTLLLLLLFVIYKMYICIFVYFVYFFYIEFLHIFYI